MKYIFALYITILAGLYAQGQETIAVPMSNVPLDTTLFDTRLVNPSYADNQVRLKNIPENIADFRIKKYSISSNIPDLHILYGQQKDGKRVVIFDSDFNGDLKNETVHIFESDNSCNQDRMWKVIDSIPETQIKVPGHLPLIIKPSIYNCAYKYKNPEDSVWHLALVLSNMRVGQFTVNNQLYTVATNAHHRLPYFYIDAGDVVTPKNREDNPPQLVDQVIYTDNEKFTIDRVSHLTDTLWITHRGSPDTLYGNGVGISANLFQSETLYGEPFHLSSLRGKYVLLDFWGSWCAPCIKLIPELVKLNNKYKHNLALVSIAYDKKENLKKLNKIIADGQMNWIHLFADQTTDDNLSVLYNVNTYPTAILIDPEGRIINRGYGGEHFDALLAFIENNTTLEK